MQARATSSWAKAVLLFRLWRAWRRRPKMPLAQLIRVASLGHTNVMNDRDLLFRIERVSVKKK